MTNQSTHKRLITIKHRFQEGILQSPASALERMAATIYSARVAAFLASVITTIALCSGVAKAQSTCDNGDTIFVIRVENFYAGCLGREGQIDFGGPVENNLNQSITQTDVRNGVTCNLRQEINLTGGGEQLSISLLNRHQFVANYDRGVFYGGGFAVTVSAYLRHPPGTPFYVSRRLRGSVIADHGGGPGRTDCSLLGRTASGVNGPQTDEELINDVSDVPNAGTVTSEPLPGRPGYFLATTFGFEALGYTCQSIPFCFPFGCPTVEYDSLAQLSGTISVGVGLPPCSGSLSVPVGSCRDEGNFGRRQISRPFDMQATFEGQCECCSYRQAVRVRSSKEVIVNGVPEWVPTSPGSNCDGHPTNGDCPVEDSTQGSGSCSGQCVRYGHREDSESCRTPGNDTYPPAGPGQTRANSCRYSGHDEPSINVYVGQRYRFEVDFEGMIVTTCGPERVLTRRRWTVCCTGTGGGASTSCNLPLQQDEAPRTVQQGVTFGPRRGFVAFWKRGSQLRGCVGVAIDPATEFPRQSDYDIRISGLPERPVAEDAVGGFGRAGAQYAVAYFAWSNVCSPSVVTADVRFGADTLRVVQDLSDIASAPAADLDDGSGDGVPDGGVTVEDLLYFLGRYQEGSAAADLDDGSGVGVPDGGITVEDLLYFLDHYSAGC